MSKRGYISRYMIIMNRLRTKPHCTYEELEKYFKNQHDALLMQDDTLFSGFSKRTLQRDIKEIKNLFGIDIKYSKEMMGYFIDNNENQDKGFERMLNELEIYNSLNLASKASPFVFLEQRKQQGTEHIFGLLHAIKNKFQIKFDYKKFWEKPVSQRTVKPHAIKEFKNRWYVLANDCKDGMVKSFALDRLTNLEITNKLFDFKNTASLANSYEFCFGIIGPNADEPSEIILSFNDFQGKYIKTLPLHHTQQILLDTKNELQVKLKLFITHDFVMELLSFGENVKVLQPKSLAREIKTAHQKAANHY